MLCQARVLIGKEQDLEIRVDAFEHLESPDTPKPSGPKKWPTPLVG